MKRRRIYILLLIFGMLILLGLIFKQVVIGYIILPVATVLWLLLRIFILSIDQQYYWWLLILAVGLFALIRLFQSPKIVAPYEVPETNPTMDLIDRWRSSILINIQATGESNTLKHELVWLLTTVYASRQQGAVNYRIKEALEQGDLVLPKPVYAFLFPVEPAGFRKNFLANPIGAAKQMLQAVIHLPQKWIRRWTGREAAAYYQAIDEVLTTMETAMEMKHDDHTFDPSND